jgi:2-phospho-L-lactate guanylyltransferase (CobY/MobA/RfbA family)
MPKKIVNSNQGEVESMSSENVVKNYLPTIERALSSFLKAIAVVIPNVDLQKASDNWIRAMETTKKNQSQNLDQFLRQVTINALTIDPKLLVKEE